jgi:hypothetical protein
MERLGICERNGGKLCNREKNMRIGADIETNDSTGQLSGMKAAGFPKAKFRN